MSQKYSEMGKDIWMWKAMNPCSSSGTIWQGSLYVMVSEHINGSKLGSLNKIINNCFSIFIPPKGAIIRAWRDDPVVKSACSSCRGLR